MKVITAEWLKEKSSGICYENKRRFKRQIFKWRNLFPNGMQLTLKNIQLCADNNLDIDWLGESLLWNGKGYSHYFHCTFDKWSNIEPYSHRDDSRSKLWREYLQHCVRPLWEAIKLDRQSK